MAGVVLALVVVLLGSAQALFDQARYDEAIAAANREIQTGRLSRLEVAAAERILGWSFVATGQREAALRAFGLALTLDPGLDLPAASTPPKVLEAFMAARAAHGGSGLQVRVVPSGDRAEVLRALVTGDPLGLVARLRACSRAGGAWQEVSVVAGGAGALVDLGRGPTGTVEYFIEALDAHGNRVATLGSAERPLVSLLAAPPEVARRPSAEPALWQRRWFWPAVLGGLATLAGGAILASQVSGDDRLPLVWRSPTVR